MLYLLSKRNLFGKKNTHVLGTWISSQKCDGNVGIFKNHLWMIAVDKVKQVSTSVFKAVATGGWDQNSVLILLKQRVSGVLLSAVVKENIGHCLLALPRGKVNFLLFLTEDSFTTWSKVPTQILRFPFHKNRDIQVLFPLMLAFQRNGFQVLEKNLPVV